MAIGRPIPVLTLSDTASSCCSMSSSTCRIGRER